MIRSYNYSDVITNEDQKELIHLTDKLINSGNYCKDRPKFQIFANPSKLNDEHKKFNIFIDTFFRSCLNYLNKSDIDLVNYNMLMWIYRSNRFHVRERDASALWHTHSEENPNKISGIYYLKNLRKESTEFKDFVMENPEPYTWYIYPSHILHRPPITKSIRNRYVIAADLF